MRYVLALLLVCPVLLSAAFTGCSSVVGGSSAVRVPPPDIDLRPPAEDERERTAVLAGGCFWCTEAVFEELRGAMKVVSGYAGGTEADAEYGRVSAGRTDHAEVIEITYDPRAITYGELLQVFFSVAHDPTQKDRQGPDTGRQYRSTIFYANEEQREVAAAYIKQLGAAGAFARPIATTLEPLAEFYPAESLHQDYVENHPDDSYVRRNSLPKIERVRKLYADKVRGR